MDVRVKFCCCCIELRLGCLIWGYLGIIGATMNYLDSFLNPILPVIINTLIFIGAVIPSICLVVAIHKNVPDLILITLLSSVVGIIIMLAAPFILPSMLNDQNETVYSAEYQEAVAEFKDHLLLACWIGAVIAVYFCIVVYSQFRAMKEEEVDQNNTAANNRDMPTINTIA